MIIGVPLFGRDVAPRFCSAEEVLLTQVDDGEIRRQARRVSLVGRNWAQRLRMLRDQGTDVLLCGGFNRSFLPLASGLGFQVYWRLEGDAGALVERYVQGDLESYRAWADALQMSAGRSASCPRRRRRSSRVPQEVHK